MTKSGHAYILKDFREKNLLHQFRSTHISWLYRTWKNPSFDRCNGKIFANKKLLKCMTRFHGWWYIEYTILKYNLGYFTNYGIESITKTDIKISMHFFCIFWSGLRIVHFELVLSMVQKNFYNWCLESYII